MRRQKHLQDIEHNAKQAQYRAHKHNDRKESFVAARRGGSTHTETVRDRAYESKAKKGFESGLLGLHGVPFQH